MIKKTVSKKLPVEKISCNIIKIIYEQLKCNYFMLWKVLSLLKAFNTANLMVFLITEKTTVLKIVKNGI